MALDGQSDVKDRTSGTRKLHIEKRIQRLRVSFAETVGAFNCFGPEIEPVPLAPRVEIHKPVGSAVQVHDY